jgi:hypothetical protein
MADNTPKTEMVSLAQASDFPEILLPVLSCPVGEDVGTFAAKELALIDSAKTFFGFGDWRFNGAYVYTWQKGRQPEGRTLNQVSSTKDASGGGVNLQANISPMEVSLTCDVLFLGKVTIMANDKKLCEKILMLAKGAVKIPLPTVDDSAKIMVKVEPVSASLDQLLYLRAMVAAKENAAKDQQLNTNIGKLGSSLAATHRNFAALTDSVAAIKNTLDGLKTKTEDMTNDHSEHMRELTGKVKHLEESVATLKNPLKYWSTSMRGYFGVSILFLFVFIILLRIF